jgi:peptidoglycan/LPS O-acetylase OafA/YrhL
MQFRNDIQGLRALAFLLVLFFHLNAKWLPGGFLGVDLFFVISGFLITSITIEDLNNNKFSFKKFFLKRIKRIIPAYFFLLLTVALVGSYIYLFSDMKYLRGTLLRSVYFLSNLLFSSGDSYFGAKLSENPLLHTWSLSIEMQFYLFLPIIIYFFRNHLLKIFFLLTILLTIYSTYQIEDGNKSDMYFSLISRIPEFFIGSIYSILFKNGVDINRWKNNFLAFGSFLILIICSFFITEKSNFPGILALLPCITGANLLVIKNNSLSDFFSGKTLVYVGQLSYSLYLWHWPIMAFIRYKNDSYVLSNLEIVLTLILTFVLAWLSFNLVENKLRRITEINFFKFLVPTFLVLTVFCFLMLTITEGKKIPDNYSKPNFGTKSHIHNTVEKFGDLTKNDSIVLIGDSHALMIKPFLDYIGKKNNFSYKTLTTDSYPALENINKKEIPNNKIKQYQQSLNLVVPTKKLIESNSIIIINSIDFQRTPSLLNELERLASTFRKDQKLILLNTFPILNKSPLKVNSGFLYQGENVSIETNLKNEVTLKKIAKKHKNIFYYDISKSRIFKTPGFINDTVAYYDANHINTFASIHLAKDLELDFMKFVREVRKKNPSKITKN